MRDLNNPAINYRPDIDGLRAVAVLSVVLYHAGVGVFSGGYIGVDVFFVISGFLITRLLLDEVKKEGRLSFKRFYLRRARRLLPAFFFTLVCSTIFAILLFSPKLLESYGASLINSLLSISNIYFYSESGYFDSASSMKPLLHTWSLGVEEQFYLVWPVLIGFLASRKWLAPVVVIALGLISLCFAQAMLSKQPDAVFFLMPFRVFEFSIGAITVWLLQAKPKNNALLELLLCVGLVLIVFSIFFYDERTPFPGASALLPCIGAALCIYAGQARFTGRLLSNKLLVALGLISYSLYLAHWPVVVFYKYYIGGVSFSMLQTWLLIAACVVIAIAMYHGIEKPFRRSRQFNSGFLGGSVFFALSISYLSASMWAEDGWGWRSWATSGSISSEAVKNGKELRFKVRQEICQRKGWASCDEFIPGTVNALVLGDSHAVDALNAFQKIYPKHNFVMSTLGGCPPFREIEKITLPNHPGLEKCKELNLSRFDVEYLKRFDYIVINVLFGWYTPDHLRSYLSFLKENDIQKVVVVGDYLVMKKDMYELLNQYGFNSNALRAWVDESANVESSLKPEVEEAGYFYLSKRQALCKGQGCELFDDKNIPFTYDENHLSYEFASRLALDSKSTLDRYLGFVRKEHLAALNESPEKSGSKVMVATFSSEGHAGENSVLSLFPASINQCQNAERINVHWDVRGLESGDSMKTQVWVKDLDGKEKLFVSGSNAGDEVTGAWARPGIMFTLKNADTGAILNQVKLRGQSCVKS
ncbi:hypothetical protein DKY63_26880 [Pseudomonas putida]|uniref:Acyltransferase n=1 Tax=Pseudomonas putida TaxID=303 RepID=A0A2Z4RQR8_PSEPU|nr:acyltransferase family protein [Pseudomonas putida]AWY43346.1 hypothetical protein DKY63_26880 [Pseudomonas putida]